MKTFKKFLIESKVQWTLNTVKSIVKEMDDFSHYVNEHPKDKDEIIEKGENILNKYDLNDFNQSFLSIYNRERVKVGGSIGPINTVQEFVEKYTIINNIVNDLKRGKNVSIDV